MPDILKDKLDYVERAAKAYAEFKVRTETSPVLTREEKIERIESFLDSHVGIFDDYFDAWSTYRRQRQAAGKKVKDGDGLSSDAKDMAEDIASVFTDSLTRDFYNRNTEGRSAAAQAGYFSLRGGMLLSNKSQEENDDSEISYSDTAEQSFQKQQKTTSMQMSGERREEKIQARLRRAQKEETDAQALKTRAHDEAVWAKDLAMEADHLAMVATEDPSAQDAANAAWEEVTEKREAYQRAEEALREAQEKVRNADAARKEARNAYVRSQAVRVTQSRADQRNSWTRQAQARFDVARVRFEAAEKALNDAYDRVYDTKKELEEAKKGDSAAQGGRDLAVMEKAAEISEVQRNRAEKEMAEAKTALDQAKKMRAEGADRVSLFERQRQERNQGLSDNQISGIRAISAFLFRNTLHGSNDYNRKFTGAFVDGINSRPPRVKLLAFYLIEHDRLHSKPDYAALMQIQSTYVPTLEGFKKYIFNGKFGGYFHRLSGEGLDWDKLSDAIHNAEDILSEAVSRQPLPAAVAALAGQPAGAAAAEGGPPMDPQLGVLMRNIAAAGVELLNNPNPSPEAVDGLLKTVDDLETYISSQEKSGWTEAKEFFKQVDEWAGTEKKTLKTLGAFLKGASERVEEINIERQKELIPGYSGKGISRTSVGLNAASIPFTWTAVPFSLVNTVCSFITVATAVEKISASKGSYAKGVAIFGVVKEGTSALLGAYGDARSISGVVDTVRTLMLDRETGVPWISNPYAAGAAAIGAILVGLMTSAQGILTIREGDLERADIEAYQSKMRRNPPNVANLSQAQREELEAQNEMLLNIAGALRDNAVRKEVGGVFKTASGVLQIVSGGLMFASGGTASLISAAISLVAFCVGIGGTITDYLMKRKAKKEVIDRYIGMDKLYADFRASKNADQYPKEYIKKYGKEDDVKYMLRKTAEARLGFPSDNKMHSYIMWRYAQALYKGAFLDESGNVLTADRESDPQSGERQKRWIFTDLIKAAGFEVKYPDPAGGPPVNNPPVASPVPDANAIYKKLMA